MNIGDNYCTQHQHNMDDWKLKVQTVVKLKKRDMFVSLYRIVFLFRFGTHAEQYAQ